MIKLLEILEIKQTNPENSIMGYKEIKLIFPKIQPLFNDAHIVNVKEPVGIMAEIHFSTKSKQNERYGDKWVISCPFKNKLYILSNNPEDPEHYPDYTDVFPQSSNIDKFIEEIKSFFND